MTEFISLVGNDAWLQCRDPACKVANVEHWHVPKNLKTAKLVFPDGATMAALQDVFDVPVKPKAPRERVHTNWRSDPYGVLSPAVYQAELKKINAVDWDSLDNKKK